VAVVVLIRCPVIAVSRQDLALSSPLRAVLAIIALAFDVLHLPHQPIHPLPAVAGGTRGPRGGVACGGCRFQGQSGK